MNGYIFIAAVISALVDLLLILSVGFLTGGKTNWYRLWAATAIGAVYVAICLMANSPMPAKTWIRICVLALMGYTAYGYKKGSSRRTALFVLLSMAMGTVASGLEGENFAYLLLSMGALMLIFLLGFGGGQNREFVQVSIPNGNQWIRVNALMDTGHSLRDPVSGESVIIVGAEVAGQLLGLTAEELCHPLDTVIRHGGLRLIPYKTVGQSGAMLLGKMIDGVCIGNRKRRCVIAFAPNHIGGTGFNALLGGAA